MLLYFIVRITMYVMSRHVSAVATSGWSLSAATL